MSRATLDDALTELYGLVADSGDLPLIDGVDVVYDHLPAYSTLLGAASLCVFVASISPDFWNLAVRLTLANSVDPKTSQASLRTLLPLIDAATNTGGYGPAVWSIEYPTGDPWVISATCVYEVGRQDYY